MTAQSTQGVRTWAGSAAERRPAEERPQDVAERLTRRGRRDVESETAELDSWYAVPPGGGKKANLTPQHVEQVVLEAMSSPERPTWPDWLEL